MLKLRRRSPFGHHLHWVVPRPIKNYRNLSYCRVTRRSFLSLMEHSELQTLEEINQYRLSKQLSPLKLSSVLSWHAEQHAMNMCLKRVIFSHEGYKERIASIKNELKLNYNPAARENIAFSNPDCSAVELWKKSPGHNGTMLTPYFNTVGIGYHKDLQGNCYWCAIFMELR